MYYTFICCRFTFSIRLIRTHRGSALSSIVGAVLLSRQLLFTIQIDCASTASIIRNQKSCFFNGFANRFGFVSTAKYAHTNISCVHWLTAIWFFAWYHLDFNVACNDTRNNAYAIASVHSQIHSGSQMLCANYWNCKWRHRRQPCNGISSSSSKHMYISIAFALFLPHSNK